MQNNGGHKNSFPNFIGDVRCQEWGILIVQFWQKLPKLQENARKRTTGTFFIAHRHHHLHTTFWKICQDRMIGEVGVQSIYIDHLHYILHLYGASINRDQAV